MEEFQKRIDALKAKVERKFWNANLENKYVIIPITKEEYKKLDEFAWKVAEAKKKENIFCYRDKSLTSLHNTFIVGICSELAVLKFIGKGIECLDLGIGRVGNFTKADLRYAGLKYGVKSSNIGNAVLVYDNHKDDEIICAVQSEKRNIEGKQTITNIEKVYICGLATAEMLNEYSSKDYVIVQNREQAIRKKGFCEYDVLISPQELKYLIDEGAASI